MLFKKKKRLMECVLHVSQVESQLTPMNVTLRLYIIGIKSHCLARDFVLLMVGRKVNNYSNFINQWKRKQTKKTYWGQMDVVVNNLQHDDQLPWSSLIQLYVDPI